MVLTKIITRNIQNHKEVVIDLPPTGLIVFTGNNSNGKSVIVKVTKALIDGSIKRPKKRASLINRNTTFGEVVYYRSDGAILTLHLTREAATVWVSLEMPNEEKIVRYLSDKSYQVLVRRFGFHYADDCDITLNIAEADDALLFYKTSYKVNGSIMNTATTDVNASKAVENMTATLKDARSFRDDCVSKVRLLQATTAELQIHDIEALTEQKEKLTRYYNILSKIYIPKLPTIEPVPKVKYVNIYIPRIPDIKYPRFIDLSCNIPDIVPVASELKALRNKTCPLCGRGFGCDC